MRTVIKIFAITALVLFLIGITGLFFCVGFVDKNSTGIYETKKIITLVFDKGKPDHLILREDMRPEVRSIVQKISGWVYLEATIHNPKGDMLPDGIDDTIKGYIKEKVQ